MRKHREKDVYTYKVEIVGDVEMFSVAFKDGEGRINEVSVSREVFVSLKQLQLIENRLAYKSELYISHYIEDADDDVSYIAFAPLPCVEDEVIEDELADLIVGLLSELTDKQRRRFLLYRIDGLTYKQIARLEKCSLLSAYQSVQVVAKKIERILKKFSEEG